MYDKIELLTKFCSSLDTTQIKIETTACGFEFLAALTSQANLDYSEFKRGIYKYRLSQVSSLAFHNFLAMHLQQSINVCIYFKNQYNSMFALNLDQAKKDTPDAKIAAVIINKVLLQLDMPPLLIASGRGYHFWCMLSKLLENEKIYKFLLNLKKLTAYEVKRRGGDPTNVNLTCYPRTENKDISLRIFGSTHVGTGQFSHIIAQFDVEDILLNKACSWDYFTDYMYNNFVSVETFERAAMLVDLYIKERETLL